MDRRADLFRIGVILGIGALLVSVFLFMGRAFSADLTVRWTPPTTNTDGTTIPSTGLAALSGYRVEYGSCVGTAFGTVVGTATAAPAATSLVFTGVDYGTWCARVFARNNGGMESLSSNVATKVYTVPTPRPPVVTIDTIAYELRMYRNNTLRFVAVGTVPLGAECGAPLAGGYATFDSAKLTKATTGGVIAAKCG